jgi:hypothetical protein
MKKIILLLVSVLALGMIAPVSAKVVTEKKEKKEKKKKEKKPYVWTMPPLTGNKDFDDYLKLCDDLNNKIVAYAEDITFYDVAEIHVIDESGEKDITYQVVDSAGNLRSSNLAFQQNMELVMSYPLIALDITNLTLASTSASLALPELGLNSLAYGKYMKAGPILIGRGGKEMKEIYKRARNQAKQIKALKEGKIDDIKALNAEINASDVEAGTASIRVIEKQKTNYDTELEKVTQEDNETPIEEMEIPEEEV